MLDPNLPAVLRPLNPLDVTKARSTLAVLLMVLAYFLPDLAAKLDPETILGAILAFMEAYDRAIGLAGVVWLWLERANPQRSLNLFAPLR